jgi:hypothetical protein
MDPPDAFRTLNVRSTACPGKMVTCFGLALTLTRQPLLAASATAPRKETVRKRIANRSFDSIGNSILLGVCPVPDDA